MSEQPWQPKIEVELVFAGDHQNYALLLAGTEIPWRWDDTSQVLSIFLREEDATELFWDLLAIIPKLKQDRR